METECPFCTLSANRVWFDSRHSVAILDGFPVTEGHTLVIPKRHVESVFQLPETELAEIWSTVSRVRSLLQKNYTVDGFNVGINDGKAAGQTIGHAHIHIIPRRTGDVDDPRGGVRWIMPANAKYW